LRKHLFPEFFMTIYAHILNYRFRCTLDNQKVPKVFDYVPNVTGIGETQTSARHAALLLQTPSASESPAYSTTALILKSLTRYIPIRVNSQCDWSHLSGLKLADPDPTGSDSIDLIIEADLFGSLLLNGIRVFVNGILRHRERTNSTKYRACVDHFGADRTSSSRETDFNRSSSYDRG